jgi:hypothetical protein
LVHVVPVCVLDVFSRTPSAIATGGFGFNPDYYQEALEAQGTQVKKNEPIFHPIPVMQIHGYGDLLFCWEKKCPSNIIDWMSGSLSNAKL